MRRRVVLIAAGLAACSLLGACSLRSPRTAPTGGPEEPPAAATDPDSAEPKVEVHAIVREFLPDASIDHYDDGTFISYDLTVLEIEAPSERAGQRLEIFHSKRLSDDSPWRSVGSSLCFEARPSDLAHVRGRQLFFGAVSEPCD